MCLSIGHGLMGQFNFLASSWIDPYEKIISKKKSCLLINHKKNSWIVCMKIYGKVDNCVGE